MRLRAATVRASGLSAAQRDEMWAVFRRYYDSVTRETFEHDLSKKNHVILLQDSGDGTIRGFSTILLMDVEIEGRPIRAVFSGDTVIEEEYWGQNALHREFVLYVLRQKLSRPLDTLYWFLISKGYKTYLLLSRNFVEYWPRHDMPTPAWERALLDRCARTLYPDEWRPELGLLRFEACPGKLKEGIAPIESHMLEHADIRFFAEKNPAHARGDELCCLGLIDLRFVLHFAARTISRALSRPKPALPPRTAKSRAGSTA